ncbi:3-methyl-2-oxobutanoate hydroxymethyltransferase [Gulosibacter sp. ACHW.36C]|uniref:3-methyl-2-oxobutanoate hydroxymethyltransferase n=1 Tax=Gulosibacter sp. ACHW.36C TaxID=3434457 RepID=UPI0032D57E0F
MSLSPSYGLWPAPPRGPSSSQTFRSEGRGEAADRLVETAREFERAGAPGLLIEMVPAEVGARITEAVRIPTVGIAAGNGCDAQVLVWQDTAGLRTGRMPRFVKQYADLNGALLDAARSFAGDVETGEFPAAEHSL